MTKKMIAAISAACFLVFSLPSLAQKNKGDISIEWGEDIPLPKKHLPFGFAGNTEDGYVQVATKGKKEISLIKINTKLGGGGTQINPFPKSKYIVLDDILEVDGSTYLLFSDYDKAANSEKLLAQEVDVAKGTFKGKPQQLLATKNTKVTGTSIPAGYSMIVTEKFKIVLPDTGDRFLIYYRKKPEIKSDKKNFDKLVYNVFDMDMKLVWSKEVTMPYVEADMKIREHAIINDEVFIFAETKSGQTFEKGKKTPAFDQLSVFKVTKNGKKIEEKELTIDKSSYIKEFVVGKGFGNSMLISGYYKPTKKTFMYSGYYTAVFNPATMELDKVRKYEFKQDLIASFESARTKRRLEKFIEKGKEIGIPYMVMRDVLKRPDGGWYMIGEQHHVTLTIDQSGKTTKYIWRFYYQDVIVSSISPEGEEEWITKLPKNQLSVYSTYAPSYGIIPAIGAGADMYRPSEYTVTSNYGSGTSSFVYGDNLYVFYMDNVKNKNLKESDSQAEFVSFKGAYLAGVKLEPDGEKNTHVVYDLKDENLNKVICPTTLVDMGNGVLLSASKKRLVLFARKNNTPAHIYLK